VIVACFSAWWFLFDAFLGAVIAGGLVRSLYRK